MAGNARLESLSASSSEPGFTGPYSNGKRVSSLDRSGSFREGVESGVFSSGFAVSRGGGNVTVVSSRNLPLSQCLSLDPISIGDRKIDRSVELKRVMGLFVGSASEDNSSGAAVSGHSKPSTPVAVAEDLKRLRSSVVDTCTTARGRANKLDEHLHKLDKYCDGVVSKKTQRNELTNNDQAGALNSKIGTQIYKKPAELVNQRVEDRPKNVLLNKRVRTSVAETRQGELRGNGIKRQHVTMATDRDLLKDSVGESEMLEEKIQRLPAGGEGWDKKMKRRRSVGTVFTRSMDSNGEPKRTFQNKVVSEPGLQPNNVLPYRLGASNGTGSTHKSDDKLEGPSLPNSSRPRFSPRNELEGPTRDLAAGSNKERVLTKGNNKLNTHDDNHIAGGNLVTKGKASRTPRISAMVAASSFPSTPRQSGTPETCENATNGSNNRKRAMPSGSTSPSMAQWVGQRPQKMSRTRRANLVSPVSNQEEKPLSSDSCSHSDVSVRMASDGNNGPIITNQFKPKLEPVESPHRLSESEESVGVQNDCQNIGPSLAIGMKVKAVVNEENCEGVRKQGRSGRGPSIARASSTLTEENLDNVTVANPIRTNRPGCEKNGSKSGRPLKKPSDRKGFSRLGHLHNSGSESTTTGNDDREELLAAANYARNASYLACSSAFWKKMEPIFAPVSSKDQFFLSSQLKEQDVHESFPQLPGCENNVVMNLAREASVTVYDTNASVERNGHVKHQGSESFSGRLDSDKTSKGLIPLFQRVLSALIVEDTIDELEQEEEEDIGNIPLQDVFCDSAYDPNHLVDYEPRKKARREVEHDSVFQSVHSVKVSFSSNGCANAFRNPSFNDSPCDEVMWAGISKNSLNRPQVIQMDGFDISSFDSQYEHMRMDDKILLELHSIGLYPELVPNMDDKKDEAIKQEINLLKIRLRQQNYKKKAFLEKICKGVGSSSVRRDLEQLALDRLVELAYRKLLATRGGSRSVISKIPKHVALAFGKRTLAKCRKFGKTGISCFNVPSLRDVLFAPRDNELEPTASVGGPVANTVTKYIGFQNPHPGSRMSSDEAFVRNGPISNRGKKKELLLDDVGTMGKRAYQGERKTKLKPKQKAGQPPIPGNGFVNQSTRTLHPVQPSPYGPNHNGSDARRDIQTVSHSNGHREMSKERQETIDPLHDLDPIDELGVGTELGGPQDLSSLLNFDVEELQDHYSAGLEIPMDDLTELNMF